MPSADTRRVSNFAPPALVGLARLTPWALIECACTFYLVFKEPIVPTFPSAIFPSGNLPILQKLPACQLPDSSRRRFFRVRFLCRQPRSDSHRSERRAGCGLGVAVRNAGLLVPPRSRSVTQYTRQFPPVNPRRSLRSSCAGRCVVRGEHYKHPTRPRQPPPRARLSPPHASPPAPRNLGRGAAVAVVTFSR